MYFDIKPQPTTDLETFSQWTNHFTAKLVSDVGKKIDILPEVGELRIKWFTVEAQAEQSGEIVTVERWDGYGWEQHGLDAHMTVEDLDALNEKLGVEL